jgi:hypothetical protein
MLSNKEINKVIDDCAKNDVKIRIRDIAYVFLSRVFSDPALVYKLIFGDEDRDGYAHSFTITFLTSYINSNYPKTKSSAPTQEIKKVSSKRDITFDENKAYMLYLKDEVEKSMEAGDIEKKDALKLLAELSVKLNDKFNVSDNNKEQLVVVNTKYDDICPYCSHEVTRNVISKEEAMKMYGLIEKVDNNE